MRHSIRRGVLPLSLLALATAAAITACGGGGGGGGNAGFTFLPPATPANPPPDSTYKAEIRRTAMGVPHIKADNWPGAGYGYGYAQAEDDLCTMADSFLTYRGERSQYFGATRNCWPAAPSGRPKNIDSDFFHRHVISADVLKKMIANAQPDNLPAGRGLCRGLQPLRARREGQKATAGTRPAAARRGCSPSPPRTSTAACTRPTSRAGTATSWRTSPVRGPERGGAAKCRRAAGEGGRGAARGARRKAPELQVGGHEGVGSNMIGFGTAATGDASPLLFGNPHWYWRGPDRFYQAQLTIPGELNISGTSFLGIPVILIGFNDNIAWSHTVSTARRFGFFQLKLASGDPTSYMRDGAAVKMQPLGNHGEREAGRRRHGAGDAHALHLGVRTHGQPGTR
jgi:acyl-homoserine-lactone acylase